MARYAMRRRRPLFKPRAIFTQNVEAKAPTGSTKEQQMAKVKPKVEVPTPAVPPEDMRPRPPEVGVDSPVRKDIEIAERQEAIPAEAPTEADKGVVAEANAEGVFEPTEMTVGELLRKERDEAIAERRAELKELSTAEVRSIHAEAAAKMALGEETGASRGLMNQWEIEANAAAEESFERAPQEGLQEIMDAHKPIPKQVLDAVFEYGSPDAKMMAEDYRFLLKVSIATENDYKALTELAVNVEQAWEQYQEDIAKAKAMSETDRVKTIQEAEAKFKEASDAYKGEDALGIKTRVNNTRVMLEDLRVQIYDKIEDLHVPDNVREQIKADFFS